MKVVLTRDVKDTGRNGDVVEVSDGHGLNFLIPKRMAVAATPAALRDAEMRQRQMKERKAVDEKLIEERLAALAEGQITITKKANEKGHLYDAVDSTEIAAAAQLPEEVIRIEKPFKELGTFEVPVAFGEQFGKFSLTIETE